jgi:hypothetical protein
MYHKNKKKAGKIREILELMRKIVICELELPRVILKIKKNLMRKVF